MKSKYAKYEKEILEMHSSGKSAAEIVKTLNEKDKDLNADQNSLRVFIKRCKDEKKQTCTAKTVPENQERAPGKEKIKEETISGKTVPGKKESLPKQEISTAKKMKKVKELEKTIANEVQKRMEVKEFYMVKEKLDEAYAVFSILNNEFGADVAKMRKRAKEKSHYFLYAGIWLLSLLFTMIGSYYIGHCFYKNTLLYGMNLLGVPAGFLVGLGIGLAKNFKRKGKTAE